MERSGDDEEAIKRLFSPEFRNRLDAVIAFQPLSIDAVARVVDKFVFQLERSLRIGTSRLRSARPHVIGSRNAVMTGFMVPARWHA